VLFPADPRALKPELLIKLISTFPSIEQLPTVTSPNSELVEIVNQHPKIEEIYCSSFPSDPTQWIPSRIPLEKFVVDILTIGGPNARVRKDPHKRISLAQCFKLGMRVNKVVLCPSELHVNYFVDIAPQGVKSLEFQYINSINLNTLEFSNIVAPALLKYAQQHGTRRLFPEILLLTCGGSPNHSSLYYSPLNHSQNCFPLLEKIACSRGFFDNSSLSFAVSEYQLTAVSEAAIRQFDPRILASWSQSLCITEIAIIVTSKSLHTMLSTLPRCAPSLCKIRLDTFTHANEDEPLSRFDLVCVIHYVQRGTKYWLQRFDLLQLPTAEGWKEFTTLRHIEIRTMLGSSNLATRGTLTKADAIEVAQMLTKNMPNLKEMVLSIRRYSNSEVITIYKVTMGNTWSSHGDGEKEVSVSVSEFPLPR
jgi:hypothetical protein